MPPRLSALLAVSILIFAAAPASAQKPRYTLTVTDHFNKKTSTSTSTQTLREKRTGRIIWVQHFPGADNITWSKDRRTVVFATGPSDSDVSRHTNQIKLVTWFAGGQPQAFYTLPEINADYTEDFLWSPDKKHLLFRTGGSGAAQTDIGRLWCLNVKTHHIVSVSESVRNIKWVGSSRIEYRRVSFAPSHDLDPDTHSVEHYNLAPYEFSKPRLWQVPKGF